MSNDDPYVYDKAKYHSESVSEHKLPEKHAANHTVVFLRWLIDHELMSGMFEQEAQKPLLNYRAGGISIHELYEWWDCCLVSDMLSDEGNAFARHYFDFQNGQYIHDYIATLQGSLPTEFHIEYSEANYQKLRPILDRRFGEWKGSRGEAAKGDAGRR